MDPSDTYFLSLNKHLEEGLDYCIHTIETRIDKLLQTKLCLYSQDTESEKTNQTVNRPSKATIHSGFKHFKAPYIRDSRNFGGPSNQDVRQIRDLKGTEDMDQLIQSRCWNNSSKQQLKEAVFDHYAHLHIIDLIKQKNNHIKQLKGASGTTKNDIEQMINLIDEQIEQVKARKDPRIFVPENREDSSIDWCSISAKLTNTHHDAQDCRLMWSNEVHWSVNQSTWTKEEDECLISAVEKVGTNDWDQVAKELNSYRLPWQCCSRYHEVYLVAYGGPTSISESDVEKIIEVINLCRIGNYVPWNQVMYFIQYHSVHQVKYQWNKYLADQKSTSNWSHTEDVLLLKLVDRFGDKDWNRIANYIPNRSNKSCRERYIMRLKFPIRNIGIWRPKEDAKLLSLIGKFGINWKLIASKFPERNNHQIRSRYELLRKQGTIKPGTVKHQRLTLTSDGTLVANYGRRRKLMSDLEVDGRLLEIFDTYANMKSKSRSLVCRSAQDENIYQTLVTVVRNQLTDRESEYSNLGMIIDLALKKRVTSNYNIFSPNLATIRGYKAWTLQQDYLNQTNRETIDLATIETSHEYLLLVKMVMSIFLWPAILSKIRPTNVEPRVVRKNSLIEKNSKNLYKVREIQRNLTSSM